jgi:hypothetical protein
MNVFKRGSGRGDQRAQKGGKMAGTGGWALSQHFRQEMGMGQLEQQTYWARQGWVESLTISASREGWEVDPFPAIKTQSYIDFPFLWPIIMMNYSCFLITY